LSYLSIAQDLSEGKSSMVEGNMGEFESQINCSNPKENFWLKACVFETTHNLSLVSCLLKDEQRLSLGEFVDGSYCSF
jgi:hypothetical protein